MDQGRLWPGTADSSGCTTAGADVAAVPSPARRFFFSLTAVAHSPHSGEKIHVQYQEYARWKHMQSSTFLAIAAPFRAWKLHYRREGTSHLHPFQSQ